MPPLLLSLFSLITFPIYAIQGTWVRDRALRLSPAAGPRSGQFGEGEPDYRILTVGDSSAAAVGIDHTSGSMCYQLSSKLHQKTGEAVSWHISGHNSAVCAEVRDLVVPNLPYDDYTHIFIMIGTNDMKNFHSVRRFKKGFGGLLYALRARFPEAKIYWHQAIDMEAVPKLPRPLSIFMNWRRELINAMGAQLCIERGAVAVPPMQGVTEEGFCEDGFHANEFGYEAWAEHYLAHLDMEPRSTPAAADHI